MPQLIDLLAEALRLLRESRNHFKSRQVAQARRLVEEAITQLTGKDPYDPDRPQSPPP